MQIRFTGVSVTLECLGNLNQQARPCPEIGTLKWDAPKELCLSWKAPCPT